MNTIELAKFYLPQLDEIFKKATLTGGFEAAADLVRATENAKTVLIPKMSLDGLADFSRATGFEDGDVTLTWTPYELKIDRGRKFSVDRMDNQESVGIAFGRLAAEFLRTKVVPEVDAYRISKMAKNAANVVPTGTIVTTEDAVEAVRVARKTMNDLEVPTEDRVLFVTAEMETLLERDIAFQRNATVNGDLNTSISAYQGMRVVVVPSTRMNTEIELGANGFAPGANSKAIQFMIAHPVAAQTITKLVVPKIFNPDEDQDGDSWKFLFRIYHDIITLENKKNAIYVVTEA